MSENKADKQASPTGSFTSSESEKSEDEEKEELVKNKSVASIKKPERKLSILGSLNVK